MPNESEYRKTEYYKKHKELAGDMYYQGKVVKIGQRKKGNDDVPLVRKIRSEPWCRDSSHQVAIVIDWYYTYYDIEKAFGNRLISKL